MSRMCDVWNVVCPNCSILSIICRIPPNYDFIPNFSECSPYSIIKKTKPGAYGNVLCESEFYREFLPDNPLGESEFYREFSGTPSGAGGC